MTTPNQTKALAVFMNEPGVLAKFSNLMGDQQSKQYIQSVLIVVSASNDLMKCSNESVLRSALRAASLGLSCDPAVKQAWIVPYWNGKKQAMEAQFQPHYKGLYALAMRTGKYWQINVGPIYDGQRVFENPLTGLHAVLDAGSQTLGQPQSYNPAYSHEVTVRRQKEQKVIGWLGYFKTKKGFEKSVYMSVMEIADHAAKYVKDYDKNPNWNDPEKRQTMEMKTVLRQLLSWADLSGNENIQLIEALQADEAPADEPITAHAEDIPAQVELHPITIEEARDTRVHTSIGEIVLGEIHTIEQLNAIYLDDNSSDVVKRAAALVLKMDWSVEPPEAPKKSTKELAREMGF